MRVLVLTVLFLAACRDSRQVHPQAKVPEDSTLYYEHRSLVDAMNMPRLEEGVDSFELRLWSSLHIANMEFVTVLRYTGNSWQLTETRFWRQFPDERDPAFLIDSLITYRITPGVPFNILVDSIKSFHLEKALSQDDIPGFVDMTADGATYTVELATKGFYRKLDYSNPQRNRDSHNTHFARFLSMMGRQTEAFVLH